MSDFTKSATETPDPLDDFFAAARQDAPELSADLRARILSGATPQPAQPDSQPRSIAQRLRGWLSGWALPGLAGGVTAGLAGLWIGLMVPVPVVALDLPLWMHEALSYVDMIALPLIGLDDPLLMGF